MEDIYTELKQRHGLPEFSILDKEFDIGELEDEHFLLRGIRKKIEDKIEDITKIFERLLHPESSFSSYREANSFSDEEREKMLDVYSRLMFFYRQATELSIEDSDEENAKYVNDFMKEWSGMKKEIMIYIKRLKESWTKEITKKEVVGYLG